MYLNVAGCDGDVKNGFGLLLTLLILLLLLLVLLLLRLDGVDEDVFAFEDGVTMTTGLVSINGDLRINSVSEIISIICGDDNDLKAGKESVPLTAQSVVNLVPIPETLVGVLTGSGKKICPLPVLVRSCARMTGTMVH